MGRENILTFKISSLVIDGADMGLCAEDGVTFNLETELLEIGAANTISIIKRLINGRKASLTFPALEWVMEALEMIISPDTALADGVLTIDTNRALASHTAALTMVGSDGRTLVIEGDVEFDPNVELNFQMKEATQTPITAWFIPDLDNGDNLCTITETDGSATQLEVSSTTPADDYSGAVTSVQWNFNLGILSQSINSSNFKLVNGAGVQIAGALSYNHALKRVTFTPTEALGATTYIAIADERILPMSGARMAPAHIINFTVA